MDTHLTSLRAFVRLAEELNFSRTAAALHISAPKLTRLIQTLEHEVGVRLMARSTHSVSLTAEGLEFLKSARRIVAEADWVGRRFSKQRVTTSATFTVGCLAGSLYEPLGVTEQTEEGEQQDAQPSVEVATVGGHPNDSCHGDEGGWCAVAVA